MDTLIVIRAAMLAVSSYCCNVCCTSPTPPASAEEQNKYSAEYKKPDPFGSLMRTLTELYKVLFYSFAVAEVGALVLSEVPKHSLPFPLDSLSPHWQHLLVLPAGASSIFTTPRIVGFSFTLFGTFLRATCFRLLHKHFTFELSLQKDHKLITYGPYGWVRHPSYTGGIVAMTGAILTVLGPGSWWAERGVDNWFTYSYGIFFAAFSVVFMLGMAKRCVVEDGVLKAHFQDEWVRWAQQTPCRLFPFVW